MSTSEDVTAEQGASWSIFIRHEFGVLRFPRDDGVELRFHAPSMEELSRKLATVASRLNRGAEAAEKKADMERVYRARLTASQIDADFDLSDQTDA